MEDSTELAPAVRSILSAARDRAAEGRTGRVDVEPRDLRRHGKRRHEGGRPGNAKQVEDVAADDVAEGDVRLLADGGGDGGGQTYRAST